MNRNRIPLNLDNIVFSLQRTGGGSVYWAHLVQKAISDSEFDVSLYDRRDSFNNYQRQEIAPSIEGTCTHFSKLPLRMDEVKRVSTAKPGLFHSSFYRLSSNPSDLNVTTVHDFICMKQYSGFLKWFSFNQIKHAVEGSDAIICITESTKRDLFRYIPSAQNKRVTIINQGYDSDTYVYHGVARESAVAFIGNRKLKYKNFHAAVSAVSMTKDIVLKIIGAPLSQEEKALLDEKLPGRYISYEFPSSSEVCEIFNSCIALLYLSEYEGFGVPILEAMASGLPVIALSKSSIPEVAGNSALLLSEADPSAVASYAAELAQQGDLFGSLVEKGLNRVGFFSWDKTVQSTTDFYKEIYYGRNS